jgi:uncharacterized membrane protein YhaH (DUF805 family)
MTDNFADLFFSYRGRIDRRSWWTGFLLVTLAASVGTWLFNDGSFDESANAVPGSLTVAAFLWLMLCLFAATSLSSKRIRDAGGKTRLVHMATAASAILISGWGVGYFLRPFAPSGETVIFWGLVGLTVPALVACATRTGNGAAR